MAASDDGQTAKIEGLITAARGGDVDALGRLLERYRAYLTMLARVQIGRRLQGKADWADLVQETFLDAARQFPNFRGQAEPELLAWLRDRLRPGGVLVVTTHGAEVARRLDAGDTYGLTPDAAAALRGCHRATGFGYAAYPWDAAYGVSLSSVDWVRATVAAMRGLELVSLHEAAWAGHQDVVALRRTDP